MNIKVVREAELAKVEASPQVKTEVPKNSRGSYGVLLDIQVFIFTKNLEPDPTVAQCPVVPNSAIFDVSIAPTGPRGFTVERTVGRRCRGTYHVTGSVSSPTEPPSRT